MSNKNENIELNNKITFLNKKQKSKISLNIKVLESPGSLFSQESLNNANLRDDNMIDENKNFNRLNLTKELEEKLEVINSLNLKELDLNTFNFLKIRGNFVKENNFNNSYVKNKLEWNSSQNNGIIRFINKTTFNNSNLNNVNCLISQIKFFSDQIISLEKRFDFKNYYFKASTNYTDNVYSSNKPLNLVIQNCEKTISSLIKFINKLKLISKLKSTVNITNTSTNTLFAKKKINNSRNDFSKCNSINYNQAVINEAPKIIETFEIKDSNKYKSKIPIVRKKNEEFCHNNNFSFNYKKDFKCKFGTNKNIIFNKLQNISKSKNRMTNISKIKTISNKTRGNLSLKEKIYRKKTNIIVNSASFNNHDKIKHYKESISNEIKKYNNDICNKTTHKQRKATLNKTMKIKLKDENSLLEPKNNKVRSSFAELGSNYAIKYNITNKPDINNSIKTNKNSIHNIKFRKNTLRNSHFKSHNNNNSFYNINLNTKSERNSLKVSKRYHNKLKLSDNSLFYNQL